MFDTFPGLSLLFYVVIMATSATPLYALSVYPEGVHAGQLSSSRAADLLIRLEKLPRHPHIHIAMGTRGLEAAIQKLGDINGSAILAVYISSTEYYEIMKHYSGAAFVTAVFMDPDPIVNIKLAQRLLGENITIGIIETQKTARLVRALAHLPNIYPIHKDGSNTSFYFEFGNIDCLLLVPDAETINLQTTNELFLSLFRRRKMMIGYSKDTVKNAGSVASAHADNSVIYTDILRIYKALIDKERPIATHPSEYKDIYNDTLLEKFGYKLSEGHDWDRRE